MPMQSFPSLADRSTADRCGGALAGDEFVIILEGLHAPEQAEIVAAKRVATIRKPVLLQNDSRRCAQSLSSGRVSIRNQLDVTAHSPSRAPLRDAMFWRRAMQAVE